MMHYSLLDGHVRMLLDVALEHVGHADGPEPGVGALSHSRRPGIALSLNVTVAPWAPALMHAPSSCTEIR